MIPKIIHYCWFGGAEIPEEYQQYISDWHQLHPDWEFVYWQDGKIPPNYCYIENALANQNWANVSNFVRLFSLLNYGGIYLDIDVKLIKKLDALLENKCFFGFEEGDLNSPEFWVNNAICGSTKNHPFIRECFDNLLDLYDGTEQANLSSPRLTTELLINHRALKNYGFQVLEDITLYPKQYFYPIHYSEVYKISQFEKHISPETISVHMWGRTWLTKKMLLQIVDDLYQENSELKANLQEARNKLSLLNN